MIQAGQLVLLISPKGKRFVRMLDPNEVMNTHEGQLSMGRVAEQGFGTIVCTHLGRPFRIVKPTLYDLVKTLRRSTQIIYPKEIGYILLKLGVGPGARVVEAGSGSGGLTTALAWTVGDTGKVYTYERRPEFARLCAENLGAAGLLHRVEQHDRDIAGGFEQTDADALFLDVRTPWDYLDQAAAAVSSGAPVGFLLPTTNQVACLLQSLENSSFQDHEVLEILLRRWKPQAERLRPDDRMVGHTGFLVFARHQAASLDIPDLPPLPGAGDLDPGKD
ncbi:MAG: tRNA (adenine-N1)-methyltransferase [Desulfohalobiaceae bacterium]